MGPLLDSPHWSNLLVTNDLAGIPRVLSADPQPCFQEPLRILKIFSSRAEWQSAQWNCSPSEDCIATRRVHAFGSV